MARPYNRPNNEVIINPDTGHLITLTPKLIEEAEQLFKLGIHQNIVANFIGVPISTFSEWLSRGYATQSGLHGELFKRCAKATAVGEVQLIAELRKHAVGAPAEYYTDKDGNVLRDNEGKPIVKREEIKGNPNHIQWMLERRYPKRFAKYLDINISSNSIVEDGINDAQLQDEKERDAKRTPEDEIRLLEAALRIKKEKLGMK